MFPTALRFTILGDLKKPKVHLNSDNTGAQTPSYIAQRLFYASAAINHQYLEQYEVPDAYLRADSDLDY